MARQCESEGASEGAAEGEAGERSAGEGVSVGARRILVSGRCVRGVFVVRQDAGQQRGEVK